MTRMKLWKILPGVLGIALLISGACNYYQWSVNTQQAANYEVIELEVGRLREAQTGLEEQLTQTKAELDQTKSDLAAVQKENAILADPDNPLAGMTEEEIDAWMRDTSDAPGRLNTSGTPQQAAAPDETAASQNSGEVQTDSNGVKMYPNIMGGDMPSCLTPEEQKELMKILDELGGVSGDEMQKGETSGGNVGENKGGNQNSSSNTTGDGGLFWREKFDYPVEYKCEYRPQYYDGYLENPWFLLLTAGEQEKHMREKDQLISTGQFPAPTAESLKSREASLRKAYNAYKGTYQPRYPDTFLLLYRDYFQEKSAEEQDAFLRKNDEDLDKYETGEKKRPTINWNK